MAKENAAQPQDPPSSQTLSRGIQILEHLAERGGEASVSEVVEALNLHRSIVYRLIQTLQQHGLVVNSDRGRIALGRRLAALARSIDRDLRTVAFPALQSAAEDLGVTCFLVAYDQGEVTTLVSVKPSQSKVTVAESPGTRHPLGVGAPGRAVLMQLARRDWPDSLAPQHIALAEGALREGYAVSSGEVHPQLQSVALPLSLQNTTPLAIASVYVSSPSAPAQMAARLETAGREIQAGIEE